MMNVKRIVVLIVIMSGCGGEITKDGTPANSGANASVGPGGQTPAGRMEQGSSDATVLDAYRRINPLMCTYDATCADPLISDGCPPPDVGSGPLPEGQCWVVDSNELTQCENALRGLMCEGQWTNFPSECLTAVRQCECLDGFVSAWSDEGQMGCYEPCSDGICSGELGCYDGACMPLQPERCADGQLEAEVNGEVGCFDECFGGDEDCAAGFVCLSGLCIADETGGGM